MTDPEDTLAQTLEHGGRTFAYAVRVSARSRTMRIVVGGPGRVEVRVPPRVPPERVRRFVEQQAAWIAAALERQSARPPEDGAVIHFLGEPLRVEAVQSVWPGVARGEGVLRVSVADPQNSVRVEALVAEWLAEQARAQLPVFLREAVERCRLHIRLAHGELAVRSAAHPEGLRLTVRAMRTRWGSCTRDGRVTLSVELMQAPRRLIDYVIVHELCHLVHLNHSPAFHFQVARCLPEWRALRRELATRAWVQPAGGRGG